MPHTPRQPSHDPSSLRAERQFSWRWISWILCAAGCFFSPYGLRADGQVARILGPASCASATCHGGVPGIGPAWHSSAWVWAAKDRHAAAGLALLNAQSRHIVARLQPRAGNDERIFWEVLWDRCASCHATMSPDQEVSELSRQVLVTGVSCEACHGPASNWIELHTSESFVGSDRFANAPNLRDNDSWLKRVEGCTRCHVGSRTADGWVRDMNHDLIAAGHPALRFDPMLFAERMPVHWDPQRPFDAGSVQPERLQLFESGRQQMLAMAARLARTIG